LGKRVGAEPAEDCATAKKSGAIPQILSGNTITK
jgi:hypothetical protein